MVCLLLSWFILIGKKVNEVLTGIITHLTFTPLQLRSPFVLQMNRSKDCFIKRPVFCQALLPIPLLEINFTILGGWTCMSSSPVLTNGGPREQWKRE